MRDELPAELSCLPRLRSEDSLVDQHLIPTALRKKTKYSMWNSISNRFDIKRSVYVDNNWWFRKYKEWWWQMMAIKHCWMRFEWIVVLLFHLIGCLQKSRPVESRNHSLQEFLTEIRLSDFCFLDLMGNNKTNSSQSLSVTSTCLYIFIYIFDHAVWNDGTYSQHWRTTMSRGKPILTAFMAFDVSMLCVRSFIFGL